MRTPDDNESLMDGPEAPPRLVRALKALPQPRPFIPPTLDAAILRQARRHLTSPQRAWSIPMPWLSWGTAAALILALGLLTIPRHQLPTRSTPLTTNAREDLNHDGRVDILDAFVLARQLKGSPEAAPPALDVNADGVIDERDVTALAAHAVQLPKGGRS